MRKTDRPIERLSYGPEEAAAAIGCSLTFFKENVAPQLKRVYIKSRVFYRVESIDRWLEQEEIAPTGRRAA
jgi:hypothetical protein